VICCPCWDGALQIKKKQTDLERGEKRLKSLQTVRWVQSACWLSISPHHTPNTMTHVRNAPCCLSCSCRPLLRPAFMDEYEKLEKELQRQYEVYLGRFRNLDYLQHELDLYHQVRLVHAWICSRALGI
jgi:hypothetical protein